MRRFLPGSRSASRTSSPSRSSKRVRIQINVPSYGGVFMTCYHADVPAVLGGSTVMPDNLERDLRGELEIDVPKGMGRKRCRAIRLTLRNICRLNMGPGRGWEEDVLFQRTIEVKGAIILEEGVQRFGFTIIVPFALAPYDVHPTGQVRLDLIAEVEGLSGRPVLPFTPVASPAPTPRRGRSPERRGSGQGSGSGSNTPTTPIDLAAAAASAQAAAEPPVGPIATQMLVSWADPVTSSEEEVQWLMGSSTASRSIWIMYNPEANNAVSILDERRQGEVPGLGAFEIRFMSDVWTVCALLKCFINVPAPDPATTIYYMRVILTQTTAIRSPRDGEDAQPIVAMTPFVVWEKGVRPPAKPTLSAPALWRGTESQGPNTKNADTTGLNITGNGRLPNDETGRPSTLEGIITPIKVTHQLVLEVFYSVWGEDVTGEPIPGQGALRLMRVDKPVIVPSCGFIPEVLDLPSYESLAFDTAPCPVCKTPGEAQACRTCPLTGVPHSRHDHDPATYPNGVCPACERRFITNDDDPKSKWADCACGFSLRHLEERMRKVIPDGGGEPNSGQITPPSVKEERGRPW